MRLSSRKWMVIAAIALLAVVFAVAAPSLIAGEKPAPSCGTGCAIKAAGTGAGQGCPMAGAGKQACGTAVCKCDPCKCDPCKCAECCKGCKAVTGTVTAVNASAGTVTVKLTGTDLSKVKAGDAFAVCGCKGCPCCAK